MAAAGSARVPCFLFFLWLVGEEDGYVHLVKLCPFVRAAIVVCLSFVRPRLSVGYPCSVAVARCLFCDGIVDQNLRRLKRCAYYTFIGATLLVLTVVAVMFARRDHKR